MAILEGYLVGLAMVIFVGPVFFTLLQNTLERGRLAGIMVALGIIVSDVLAVGLCVAGSIAFLQKDAYTVYVSLLGAFLLFAIGGRYIFRPATNVQGTTKYLGLLGAFWSGFLVNFVNPFVLGVWLTVIAYGGKTFGLQGDLYWFLSGSLLGILSTDMLKVFLAHRIKSFMQPNRLALAYRIIGLVMVGFGVRLVLYATCGGGG